MGLFSEVDEYTFGAILFFATAGLMFKVFP